MPPQRATPPHAPLMQKTAVFLFALILLVIPDGWGEVRMVTTGGDTLINPAPGTFRHAVQGAQAGDVVKFASPIAIVLEGNVSVRADQPNIRIEGPGQIGFKRKPQIGEASLTSGLQIFASNVTVENLGFRNAFLRVIGDVGSRIVGFRAIGCNFVAVGGIDLSFTTGALIENNVMTITNVSRGQPGISLGNTISTTVRGNSIETRGGAAFVGEDEADLLVEQNTFKRHVGAHLQSGRVANNTVEKARLSLYAHGQTGPIVVEENVCATLRVLGTDLTVRNNTVQGNLSTAEDYRWPPFRGDAPEPAPFTAMHVEAVVNSVTPLNAPILIEGNEVTGGRVGFLFVQHVPTTDTTLRDNTVTSSTFQGIALNVSQPVLVETNTITACRGAFGAIHVIRGTNALEITENQITDNLCRGILIQPGHSALVKGNTVQDNRGEGLYLQPTASVQAEDNTFEKNRRAGIFLGADSTAELDNNTLRGTAGPGIKAAKRAHVKGEGNVVEANAGPGILLQGEATANLSKGAVRNNRGAGITISTKSLAEISQVSFTGNLGPGIDVAAPGSTPNKFPKRGNNDLDFPDELTFDASARMIRGKAEPGVLVELFRVESGARSGNPRNGEGVTYVGSTVATGNGMFSIPPGPCAPGDKFCLTATRGGSPPVTSEFSEDVECLPGPVIERVNVSSNGDEANGPSVDNAAAPNVSANGRFVVFSSEASNLVNNDGNNTGDVFVRDTMLHTTTRVSVSFSGGDSTYPGFTPYSTSPSISADGRWIAFSSNASNLVPGDENGFNYADVFLHDRENGTTVAITDPTKQANDETFLGGYSPAISADGNFVAFASEEDWLPSDTNNNDTDIYVWNRASGALDHVSVSTSGEQVSFGTTTGHPRLSGDGRYVVFETTGNLHAGTTTSSLKTYVRDRQAGTTELISRNDAGTAVEGRTPAISSDGNFVAFITRAGLVASDTNGKFDVYVRERQAGVNTLVSFHPVTGTPLGDSFGPYVSGNGRYVAFYGPGESSRPDSFTVLHRDVYVYDRETGTTVEGSIGIDGDALGPSDFPTLTPDGRFLLFRSAGGNLVEGDENEFSDLFLRDRAAELADTAE
jgi:Tol biopolymer transport system component